LLGLGKLSPQVSVNLKNEGDDDLSVSLLAEAPKELAVTFKSSGKDITNLPVDIKAGSSERTDISAEPLTSLEVGKYPFTVTAWPEYIGHLASTDRTDRCHDSDLRDLLCTFPKTGKPCLAAI
jgi:uncharacterized membrane protein